MNQKFFKKKYISKSNTVNNMKLMILEKIRVIHTCSSSPRAASVYCRVVIGCICVKKNCCVCPTSMTYTSITINY